MSLPRLPIDEDRRRRFEEHRLAGGTDSLAAFLPEHDAETYAGTLEELVCIDLEVRFKGEGPDPRVDEYACDFPELAAPDVTERLEREITWLRTRRGAGATPAPGDRLGRYVLEECVGRGAFAQVWRARDEELRREVAVKLPRPELAGEPGVVARLLREARSAARLHHPSIVPVFEAADEDGRPYIVSEFVDGPTLARAIGEAPIAPEDAARLVAQLADALDYAHQCGVVHRDVKPGNVLLAGGMRPVLTDFGLAHLADSEAVLTRHGEVLGTPAYMSPEQARGEGTEVDGRTDVYSLGVVLYELLSGRTPFTGKTAHVVYSVIHDEPPPPGEGDRDVPEDLETVCLMAMGKEPDRRYASAGDFAADLRRYLDRRPIHARRRGPFGRLVLWTRRNPALAATLVASAVVLATVSSLAFSRVLDERERFREQRDRAQELLYGSLVGESKAILQAQETGWYGRSLDAVRRAAALDVPTRDVRALRDLAARVLGAPRPSFEPLAEWQPSGGRAVELAVRGFPRVLAGVTDENHVWLRDAETGAVVAERQLGERPLRTLTFTPRGHLAVAGDDGTVWFLDDELEPNPAPRSVLGLAPIRALAFAPDGNRMAIGCEDGRIEVATRQASRDRRERWELLDEAMEGHDGGVNGLVFEEDGTRLVSSGNDGALRTWEWPSGRPLGAVESLEELRCVDVDPGTGQIVTHSLDTFGFRLLGRDAEEFERPAESIHEAAVTWVLFDTYGRIVTASADGTLRCFDTRFREQAIAGGGFPGIVAAALHRETGTIYAAHEDGTVRVWRLLEPPARRFFQTQHGFAFVPGTARLIGHPHWLDCDDPRVEQSRTLGGQHGAIVWGVAASADGRWVATSDHAGEVNLWDAAELTEARTVQDERGVAWAVVFSPDSTRLAVCHEDGVVLIDVASGDEVTRFGGHELLVVSAAFHPTEPVLVSAALDGRLLVHDLETDVTLGALRDGGPSVHQIAFSPDGKRLAAACHDGVVRVWSLDATQWRVPFDAPSPPSEELTGHTTAAWAVAFDPTGRYLATGDESGAVLLRDAESLATLVTLRSVTRVVRSLSFDDTARRLAVGAWIRKGVVWDLDEVRRAFRPLGLDWD